MESSCFSCIHKDACLPWYESDYTGKTGDEALEEMEDAFGSECKHFRVEVVQCKDCSNYVALNIVDQFGNIVKHTGRGCCKHTTQRGNRHDDDWCKWSIPKGEQKPEEDPMQMNVYDFTEV